LKSWERKMTDLARAGTSVKWKGITYRSVTEAKWAVFLTFLGIKFEHEPERIPLVNGETYLPDFKLDLHCTWHDVSRSGDSLGAGKTYERVWLEVKPASDGTIIGEINKPLTLTVTQGEAVWIACGAPSIKKSNIIRLERLGDYTSFAHVTDEQAQQRTWEMTMNDLMEYLEQLFIEETADPRNFWHFLEDRRDARLYWIQRGEKDGEHMCAEVIGGPGTSTQHDRYPVESEILERAYAEAANTRFARI
jgi:hypothetical protein